MATTLIGTAAAQQFSIATTQSGINVESISYAVEPEFREDRMDITGHITGQAVSDSVTTLTVSGETIRSGGALQGVLAGDFSSDGEIVDGLNVPSADVPKDGPDAVFIPQSVEVTQTRGSFETSTATYISRSNLPIT